MQNVPAGVAGVARDAVASLLVFVWTDTRGTRPGLTDPPRETIVGAR